MEGQNGAGVEQQGRKLHTAEFKAKVMREHLEGGVALSDLAEKYQVHINSLYLWKKQLFENVADVFSGKHEKVVKEDEQRINKLEAEIRRKDSLIAGLVEDNIALKKKWRWGALTKVWVEPDVRDEVVGDVRFFLAETTLPLKRQLGLLGISKSKFHSWSKRCGELNHHNAQVPKEHWLLPWERSAILDYYRKHPEEGYRRLTYTGDG